MSTRGRVLETWTWPWRLLLVGCVGVVGVVDTALIAMSTGFFTSGFNGEYISGIPLYAGFVASSILLDGALVVGIWLLLLPVLALLRAGQLQAWLLLGIAGAGFPLLVAAAKHNLYSLLGNMVSLSLLSDTVSGSSSSLAGQAFEQFEVAQLIVPALAVLGVVAVAVAARRIESRLGASGSRFAVPSVRTLVAAFLFFTVLGTLILAAPTAVAGRLQYGLVRKSSALLLRQVVSRVTDVDLDGYGLLARWRDPAPFDGEIHPYAIDVPANGQIATQSQQ